MSKKNAIRNIDLKNNNPQKHFMNDEQIKKIIVSCYLNFLIGSGASKPFLGTPGDIDKTLRKG